MENLVRLPDISWVQVMLPGLIQNIANYLGDLTHQHIPIEDLVITQTLCRELDAYVVPSPVAKAAAQLRRAGKEMRPGQRVRFIYTRGEPGTAAWDLLDHPSQENRECRTVPHLVAACRTYGFATLWG